MSWPWTKICGGCWTTGEVEVKIPKLLLATPRPLTVIWLGLVSLKPRFAGSGVTVSLEMRTATNRCFDWLGKTETFKLLKVATPPARVAVDSSVSTGAQPLQVSGSSTPSALR